MGVIFCSNYIIRIIFNMPDNYTIISYVAWYVRIFGLLNGPWNSRSCPRYAVFTDAMCKGAPGKRVVEAIARDEEGVPLCVDGDY